MIKHLITMWCRRRAARRERRWIKVRIPADVRERIEKCGEKEPPDWYVGREEV